MSSEPFDRHSPRGSRSKIPVCRTTRVKSAIVFSLMIDGSGSLGCRIFGRLRPVRKRGAMCLTAAGNRFGESARDAAYQISDATPKLVAARLRLDALLDRVSTRERVL